MAPADRLVALWLALVTILGVMVLWAAVARGAPGDDTWTGASTTSPNWSQAGNWLGGAPPSPAGTLTFPELGSCLAPSTCYTSNNDVAGITANALVFSSTSGGYTIGRSSVTVGPGGLPTRGKAL